VGTRAAGLEEAITPGVTGELVAAEDPVALADALERLIRDPGLIDRLSASARGRVDHDFDADRNFERLWALLESDGARLETAPDGAPAAMEAPAR
jgi:glycosyltransferase involved in cell wall biosynthesis